MTRILLFLFLYVIAFLLGVERRGRYDEYMMRKPHMQARLRIFAQECLLYNPEAVPEEERDELLPPSTIDALAFNAAMAMRAVRERQAELDKQLKDAADADAGELEPADPDPDLDPAAYEPAAGPDGDVDGYADAPSVPVDEADATTRFGVVDDVSATEEPGLEPAYERPAGTSPAPSASAPEPSGAAERAGDADPVWEPEVDVDRGVEPGLVGAPDPAGDLSVDAVPASGAGGELDPAWGPETPGLEPEPGREAGHDDPALSILEELEDDLPLDGGAVPAGSAPVGGYEPGVPESPADEHEVEEPGSPVSQSAAAPPLPVRGVPSGSRERSSAPGGAYGSLVEAMKAGGGTPEGPGDAGGPSGAAVSGDPAADGFPGAGGSAPAPDFSAGVSADAAGPGARLGAAAGPRPVADPDPGVDPAYGSLPPGVARHRPRAAAPRPVPVPEPDPEPGPGPEPEPDPGRETAAEPFPESLPVAGITPEGARAVETAGGAPDASDSPGALAEPEPRILAEEGGNPALSRRVLARQRALQRAADADRAPDAGEKPADLDNLGPGVTFTPARSRRRRTPEDT